MALRKLKFFVILKVARIKESDWLKMTYSFSPPKQSWKNTEVENNIVQI